LKLVNNKYTWSTLGWYLQMHKYAWSTLGWCLQMHLQGFYIWYRCAEEHRVSIFCIKTNQNA